MEMTYSEETNKRLVGRTILQADVNGHGMTLVLDNGVRLEYFASDGGYSCWELCEGNKEGGAK